VDQRQPPGQLGQDGPGSQPDRPDQDGQQGRPGQAGARGQQRTASRDWTLAATVLRKSTTRGPQREATSSSRATTPPLLTAVSWSQPSRAATVLAVWPQHLVSARKIRSGSALTTYSADSCG